jgi:hypothetical protein
MALLGWLPVVLALLLQSAPAQTPSPAPSNKAGGLERLVEQLADGDYSKRDAAAKELKRIGSPALPLLRKALDSQDSEIRRWAEILVPLLERQADSEKALKPTLVRLHHTNAPLGEVLKDLQQQTKYRFQIAEKDKSLAERPVTLTTGEIPFWDAMDQLSRQVRLSYELGCNDTELNLKENPLSANRRVRQSYTPQRAAAKDTLLFYAEKEKALATKPVYTCGAVRCTLDTGLLEAEKLKKAERAKDSEEVRKENRADRTGRPAAAPGAPAGRPQPPAAPPGVAGGGGMGGGGRGQPNVPPPPPVNREQRRSTSKEKEPVRPVRTLTLEVCTEPKLQWRGPLQVCPEPLVDDKKQEMEFLGCQSNRKLDPGNEPVQIVGVGPNGKQVLIQGDNLSSNDNLPAGNRQEFTLQYRLPENPGKVVPLLKGCLIGQVLSPVEQLFEVADVTRPSKEPLRGPDGMQLQVVECAKAEKGKYRLTVELITPGVPANLWAGNQWQGGQVGNPRFGGNGRMQRMNNAGMPNDFTITDAKGQPMTIQGRTENNLQGKGTWVRRLTFLLITDTEETAPRKLVYAAARLVSIEVPFEFRNVPLQ